MMYDLSELKKYSRGDAEFELDMIQTFIEEASEYFKSMLEKYRSNEISGLGCIAHKFKSSVDVFGMTWLRAILDEIERKSKSPAQPSEYSQLMINLDEMVHHLIDVLTIERANYLVQNQSK